MAKHDITMTNVAVRRLLETTTNPRHRFLLMAYDRHRNLEMAGRFEEIFAPEMMAEKPVYHVHADKTNAKLEGQDAVKSLYRMWAETNQSIFYTENEQVAVADNFIASVTTVHQQVSGASLTAVGEDVWEPDPDKAEIIKLEPGEVHDDRASRRAAGTVHEPTPVVRRGDARLKPCSGAPSNERPQLVHTVRNSNSVSLPCASAGAP